MKAYQKACKALAAVRAANPLPDMEGTPVGCRGVSSVIHENNRIARAAGLTPYSKGCGGDFASHHGGLALPYVQRASNYTPGFRDRRAYYAYTTWVHPEVFRATLDCMPTGWSSAASDGALPGEITVPVAGKPVTKHRQRLEWNNAEKGWDRLGVAWRAKSSDPWEHGRTVAECRAEIKRKVRVERERQAQIAWERAQGPRLERRIRLITRLCAGAVVRYGDVRELGACDAGIRSWCHTHGVDPEGSVTLPELARTRDGQPYALKLARKLARR